MAALARNEGRDMNGETKLKACLIISIFLLGIACTDARYIEENYIGGWYVFADTYGLTVVGGAVAYSVSRIPDRRK